MQVKDITDEMIYAAIRQNKTDRKAVMRSAITDWDELDSWEKLRASIALVQLEIRGMKGVPRHDKFCYDYIDAPVKVVLRKMEKMVDQGKLEYGTSLRTAWIVGEEE